jgi:hypothetical protein
MQIITLKIEKTSKVYLFGHYKRNDPFYAVGGFLDEYRSLNESLIKWLCDPFPDDDSTELICIAKKDGIVYLKYPCWDEVIRYDDPAVFKESALKLVKLSQDLENMKKQEANEIVIMRENNNYYLKSCSLDIVGFIKKETGTYKTLGYSKENKLGAFAEFLTTTEDFSIVFNWLKNNLPEIPVPIGRLVKNNNVLIIEYDKLKYPLPLTSTIPLSLFPPLIEQYQQLVNQGHEEFLLLEEPDYFSFMTNPFEEIKIPKIL